MNELISHVFIVKTQEAKVDAKIIAGCDEVLLVLAREWVAGRLSFSSGVCAMRKEGTIMVTRRRTKWRGWIIATTSTLISDWVS